MDKQVYPGQRPNDKQQGARVRIYHNKVCNNKDKTAEGENKINKSHPEPAEGSYTYRLYWKRYLLLCSNFQGSIT